MDRGAGRDGDAFSLPALQHSSSLGLDFDAMLSAESASQPSNNFDEVLRSMSHATSAIADDLPFDLTNEPLQLTSFAPATHAAAHIQASAPSAAGGASGHAAAGSGRGAAAPQHLQQLANYLQPNYTDPMSHGQQLAPYQQSLSQAAQAPSSASDLSLPFSAGVQNDAVVPARRRARGGSKEDRQMKRKLQHAATDKQRRQTLAQLNTQLRDLICSIGAVDGSGKVEQTLVLEKAIEMIQAMSLQSAGTDLAGHSKQMKLYNQPVITQRTGLQSLYDNLAQAYRYAAEHVMQYEICFHEDPNFVATAASDALRAMEGVGFTANEYYVLQDCFGCDWLESPDSGRYMRQQMFGRRLVDPPFFSTVPTILNHQDLPTINGDKQSWSDYLVASPPNTLLYGLVQYSTGRGHRYESVIAIGWVRPYNNRPGRKLMVATREGSRKISTPSAEQLLATLNQYNQIKDAPPASPSPSSDSSTPPISSSPYSASIAESTDGSSLSSSSSVAELVCDDLSGFEADFPAFIGAS